MATLGDQGRRLVTTSAERVVPASAVATAVVACVMWTGPSLFRPDRFSDDARQHVFWLYRYADPTLFPGDPSAAYFSSTAVSPWGYRAVYAVLAAHLDALFAAKLLAIALLIVTLWLAWQLGTAVARRTDPDDRGHKALTGLFAVVALAALLPYVDLLPNVGFQRSYSMPATLLCLWALVSGRYLWAGLSWLLAALTYPVLIPVLGMTSTLVMGWEWIRTRRLPSMWHANLVLGLTAIVVAFFGSRTPPGMGPTVTGKQALGMAEFGPAGRQNLGLHGGLHAWFDSDRTGLGWSPYLVGAVVFAVVLTMVFASRASIPGAAWTMLAVGIGLWFVARWTLFDLYLPNRHSRYSVGAFAVVAFAVAACAAVELAQSRLGRRSRVVAAVVAPAMVGLALLPSALHEARSTPDVDKERTAAYLRHLPRNTLVAAHPDAANSIPLRTRRSVLASTEAAVAFQSGYYSRIKPRIQASLQASYAASWNEVEAALAPYDVDVFVVVPDMWEWSTYYSPFSGMTALWFERGQARGFALQHPPKDRVLFRSGDVFVVRVGPRLP